MYRKIGLFFSFVGIAYAGEKVATSSSETLWIWVALFALGAISVLILFFSSRQMAKMKKMHEKLFSKQLEMEKKQIDLLTNMSENIHSVAKEALEKSTQAIEKVNASGKDDLVELANVEDTLLDITNDLIEFLRLKSKKVEIFNGEFNLNNVLNELSGTLCSRFHGSRVELIFDIDNAIPRRLIGDSLHLGQILNNILENCIENLTDEELKLKISMFSNYEEKIELQFQITDYGSGMSEEERETLFMPYYDDKSSQYVGLGLFVAKELVSMMGGELSVQSNSGKGSTYTITLPFAMVDYENKRRYRLPAKELTDKKVFIVDSSYNSALAIKKMFAYFRHDVKVVSIDKFRDSKPKLTPYDIVVLDESLFSVGILNYIKEIKAQKDIKVIALNSLLRINHDEALSNDVVDKILMKPLNQERVFEVITTLYESANKSVIDEIKSDILKSQKAQIYKSDITETKNIKQHDFYDFNGKKILIVEDNVINQKVLTNILHLSGMEITIANNGQEAVNLITKAKAEVFDLVLMDINMPVMDGFTATRAIREDKRFDNLPIVAFTALVLESEIRKMFDSGMNAYLDKPIKLGKLYSAFTMFLLDNPNEQHSVQDQRAVSKVADVKDLPGLNVIMGISHSNNSQALYMEILKEFIDAYGKSYEVFATLVMEHRYEQLKMLCLDMKGLSGTIGAEDMNVKIEEVQKLLLYNKYELLNSYVDIYKKELLKLMKSIHTYIELKS
jgi:CheY-like chemotaxis protein